MRHFYPGADNLVATLSTRDGTSLSAQSVAFSFDNGATWLTAAWLGSAGTTRQAYVAVTTPAGNLPAAGTYDVLARISSTAFKIGRAQVH